MKKSIYSLALVAAMGIPMVASAQEVGNSAQVAEQQSERIEWQNPSFKDIELTDEQRQQLSEIENPFFGRAPKGPQDKDRVQNDGRRSQRGHGKKQGRHQGRHQLRQMADCPNVQQCEQAQCQKNPDCPMVRENQQPVPGRQGFNQRRSPERHEMMQKMVTARTEYLQKVSQILTPEQYNKFLENMVIYQHMPMRIHHESDFQGGHPRKLCPANAPASEEITNGVVVGIGQHKIMGRLQNGSERE